MMTLQQYSTAWNNSVKYRELFQGFMYLKISLWRYLGWNKYIDYMSQIVIWRNISWASCFIFMSQRRVKIKPGNFTIPLWRVCKFQGNLYHFIAWCCRLYHPPQKKKKKKKNTARCWYFCEGLDTVMTISIIS